MEIFFNLVWLALSLSLIAGWVFSFHSASGRRPGDWGRQAVALGILLVVLLPVVSLTDDLQCWTSPAEVEHGLRRADSVLEIAAPSQIPALWFHDVLITLSPITHLYGDVALACDSCNPQMGELHPLENRPPPAAL